MRYLPFLQKSVRFSVSLTALLCLQHASASPSSPGQDWAQWRGANREGIWRETGLVTKFDGPKIKTRWSVPVSNGYSGPTVAGGRVYLTDRLAEPTEQERVLCFDWKTGNKLWSYAYDCKYDGVSIPDGPRASVTVQDGRAYALGATGWLHCFDAAKGKILWKHDANTEYKIRLPDWGVAAAPLIEENLVIVMVSGSDNACLLAFDKRTGKEAWRALPDRASYSSPIVINQVGKRVMVCWTAERVVGLDPKSGKLYWEYPWPSKGTNIDGITTPVVHNGNLFITSVYEGSLMLHLASDKLAVEKVWEKHNQNPRAPVGLQTMMATPILQGDHLYGIDYNGELRCLDSRTGERVWENTTIMPRGRWASAHLVQNGEKVWIFNEKGELIISKLSPKGYEEISRAKLIKPTLGQLGERGGVAWSHPAFAYQHVFVRSDEELVCASLKASTN